MEKLLKQLIGKLRSRARWEFIDYYYGSAEEIATERTKYEIYEAIAEDLESLLPKDTDDQSL